MIDPTIGEFSLNHADSRSFNFLHQLMCGATVILDETNVDIFENLIEDLENQDLNEIVINFVEGNEVLKVSNCISRLNKRLRMGIGVTQELNFIASHF
jgi:hypothetical protein